MSMTGGFMKNFIFIALLILGSISIYAKTYTIVCEEYPPYEYLENGKAGGLNIEILQAIGKQAGIRFVFKFNTWDEALSLVRNKEADGIISLLKTEEREEFLLFPNQALAFERNIIFAKNNFNRVINKVEDLRGLIIGVTSGYSYGKNFDTYIEVSRDYSENQETMIRKFANNRYQIFITNEIVGHYLLDKFRITNYKTMPYIADNQMLYLGITKDMPDSELLLEKVNTAMEELSKSGELERIRENYISHKE